MLCLPGPYGWNSFDGAWISLLATESVNPHELEHILLRYSCHRPAIPKIKTCLEASGRYDCILQAGWFRDHGVLAVRDLAEIGVTLVHHGYLRDGCKGPP